jgi:hypothetical protein
MSIISNITAAIFFKDIVSDVDQSLNIDYKNNNCYILWDPTCPSDIFSIEAPDEVLQKLFVKKHNVIQGNRSRKKIGFVGVLFIIQALVIVLLTPACSFHGQIALGISLLVNTLFINTYGMKLEKNKSNIINKMGLKYNVICTRWPSRTSAVVYLLKETSFNEIKLIKELLPSDGIWNKFHDFLLNKLNNDLVESIESELIIKNDKNFKNFVNVYYDITEVLNNNYKSKN